MADIELNAKNLNYIFAEIKKKQVSFSGRFYAKLYELYPEVEELFKSVGMEMQAGLAAPSKSDGVFHVGRGKGI